MWSNYYPLILGGGGKRAKDCNSIVALSGICFLHVCVYLCVYVCVCVCVCVCATHVRVNASS